MESCLATLGGVSGRFTIVSEGAAAVEEKGKGYRAERITFEARLAELLL
jgi:hypothetical protein